MSALIKSHNNRDCLSSGSCEAVCGGGSDHTCWCDSLCLANGDCCCDKEAHCPDDKDSSEVPTQDITPAQASSSSTKTTSVSPSTDVEPVMRTEVPEDSFKEALATCSNRGSCNGRCGGGSDHDCWCDDHCMLYHTADCCCDLDQVCGVEHVQVQLPARNTTVCSDSGSCSGRCGDGSDDDCWCDDLCEETGDCCCDKEMCPREPALGTNGNITSITEQDYEFSTELHIESTTEQHVFSTELYASSTELLASSTKLDASSTEKTTSSAGCSSGCTTDTSGPRHNRCCVFPFIFEGKTHSTCIEVDGNKSWCSTKGDHNGAFIENEWGYCGDQCVFDTPVFPTDSQGMNVVFLYYF